MMDKTRQAQPRSRLRKGYHIDLSDLHAQCEANYHRLMRLFPAYEPVSYTHLTLPTSHWV